MNVNISVGEKLYGFIVKTIQEVSELRAISIHLVHERTGMEVWHLYNNDEENLFSFIVKTIPLNDKGIPHILEHCVLRGSQKFSDVSLLKLMQKGASTYLNGWTLADKTIYIGSSINKIDYFNDLLFFGNAIFYPEISEKIFSEEAFHVSNDKRISGIVFNEMMGKYSIDKFTYGRKLSKSLFNDNCYRYDSGGIPSEIVKLSLDEVLEYHKECYHPSNIKLFLSGNIDTKVQLKYLSDNFHEVLGLNRKEEKKIDLQNKWKSPKYYEGFYQGNKLSKSNILSLGWLTDEVGKSKNIVSLRILADMLLHSKDSILYKNLMSIDNISEICYSSGLDEDHIQSTYNLFFKCEGEVSSEKVLKVFYSTLNELCEKRLYEENINLVSNRMILKNREMKRFGGGPYSLYLMRKFVNAWSYGESPKDILYANSLLSNFDIRKVITKSDLQKIIQENFLHNQNRASLMLRPDDKYIDRELKKVYEAIKSNHTDKSKDKKNAEVKVNEDLKLQSLKLEDFNTELRRNEIEKFTMKDEVPLYFTPIYTNGVVYIDILFDVSNLTKESSVYLPLWGKAMNFNKNNFNKISGGINYTLETGRSLKDNKKKAFCRFSVKVLPENIKELVLELCTFFNNKTIISEENMKKILSQYKRFFFEKLNYSKSETAVRYLKSLFSSVYDEQDGWQGIKQAKFIELWDCNMDLVLTNLMDITKKVINKKGMVFNIISEEKYFNDIYTNLNLLISSIDNKANIESYDRKIVEKDLKIRNYILTNTNVNYIAKSVKGSIIGTKEELIEKMLCNVLRNEILWDKVRNKGGAYNVDVRNDGMEGIFTFLSSEDSNIETTLKSFEESLISINSMNFTDKKIDEMKLSLVARETIPMSPLGKGRTNFKRSIYGITNYMMNRRRQALNLITEKDIKEHSEYLLSNYSKGFEVIITSKSYKEKIDSSKERIEFL